MRIDRITLSIVQMHLKHAFRASSHAANELNHVLVRAEGDGVVGWGECATTNDPFYLGETFETAWYVLKEFVVPRVLGATWNEVADLRARYDIVKDHTFAKAGLEMAAWDMLGRARGQSLASMLGGTRTFIESGVSLGLEDTPEQLFEHVTRYVAEGYRRFKIKIAPGKDVALVRRVREQFPDLPLMVDANAAYTLADVDHLKQLDPFDLMMIEQPLAVGDLVDHAKVQKRIRTPVCLDESIRSARDAEAAIELGACKIMNVKIARVGGPLEAKRVHDVCHAAGVPVWCGGMHDFGIGRAANVALASLAGFSIPGDVSGSDKYFVEDIVEPAILADRGRIDVPAARPGLGFETVEERVRAHTIREITLTR